MPRALRVYVPAPLAHDFKLRCEADPARSAAVSSLVARGPGWHLIPAPMGRRLLEDARIHAFDPASRTAAPRRRDYRAFYYQLHRQLRSFDEFTQEDQITQDLRCLVRSWVTSRRS